MTLETILKIAKAYERLGWAVQSQLDEYMNGAKEDELNPNALKQIAEFLQLLDDSGVEDLEWLIDELPAALRS